MLKLNAYLFTRSNIGQVECSWSLYVQNFKPSLQHLVRVEVNYIHDVVTSHWMLKRVMVDITLSASRGRGDARKAALAGLS